LLAYHERIDRLRAMELLEMFEVIRIGVNGDKEAAGDLIERLQRRASGKREDTADAPVVTLEDEASAQAFLRSIGR
jgi:hypothetical protein